MKRTIFVFLFFIGLFNNVFSQLNVNGVPPKVSVSAGNMSFWGDVGDVNYQPPLTSRYGFELAFTHQITKYLQLNFNFLYGKLGANENTYERHENFQSEIRYGGFNLLYDFGNFIPDKFKIRPFVTLGAGGFEFLSKKDLFDKNGNRYYYWADGSIRNLPENDPKASQAIRLVRDYYYETDIRESNLDGYGKYPERSWAFPMGAGAIMKITDHFDFKIGATYFFTTTDYIDGIAKGGQGIRKGDSKKDKWVYSYVSFQYDLFIPKKKSEEQALDTLPDSYFDGVDWMAIDSADTDGDGVKDWFDKCQGTPKSAKIYADGCPEDTDGDGVPDYKDDENPSPKGFEVNMYGVALTDEYWQNWYNEYFDSTGDFHIKQEYIDNVMALKDKNVKNAEQKIYTVELAKYKGGVPSDEIAYLMSIGDVRSMTLEDGTTVVYTAGQYEDVQLAIKRRDEFRQEGLTKANVGYFKNDQYYSMTDEELNNEVNKQKNKQKDGIAKNNDGTSNNNNSNGGNNISNNVEEFKKDEVIYRVQLGAFRKPISKEIFKNVPGGIIEFKTDDGLYKYAGKAFKTMQEAAEFRAKLVLMGYSDAFVTAYKDRKRIPLSEVGVTMTTKEKENLKENVEFSSIDKGAIVFKVQLGALKKPDNIKEFEAKTKNLNDVQKQSTILGLYRFTTGNFNSYEQAQKYLKELQSKGFDDAFIIATFNNELIPVQDAIELQKM
ncbi:MAG TPA: SPOR domain-containing protein [Bacteroidia bacterium]|nr:SPOR domain-containing protein [Bacteroidia bacterium]